MWEEMLAYAAVAAAGWAVRHFGILAPKSPVPSPVPSPAVGPLPVPASASPDLLSALVDLLKARVAPPKVSDVEAKVVDLVRELLLAHAPAVKEVPK